MAVRHLEKRDRSKKVHKEAHEIMDLDIAIFFEVISGSSDFLLDQLTDEAQMIRYL